MNELEMNYHNLQVRYRRLLQHCERQREHLHRLEKSRHDLRKLNKSLRTLFNYYGPVKIEADEKDLKVLLNGKPAKRWNTLEQ